MRSLELGNADRVSSTQLMLLLIDCVGVELATLVSTWIWILFFVVYTELQE
jgi:hypothetical protein